MQRKYLIYLFIFIFSNSLLNSQCKKNMEDLFSNINKDLLESDIELNKNKVKIQNITLFQLGFNNSKIGAFQFCLDNNSNVFYQSIKYKVIIKSKDGKIIFQQIFKTDNISLNKLDIIPIKQILNTPVNTKYSIYSNQLITDIEILDLGVDKNKTTNYLFDYLKNNFSNKSIIEEKYKNVIIKCYEFVLNINPSYQDQAVKDLYLKCKPSSSIKNAEIPNTQIRMKFETFCKNFKTSFINKDFNRLSQYIKFPLPIFQIVPGEIIKLNEKQFIENYKQISEDWKIPINKSNYKNFKELEYSNIIFNSYIKSSDNNVYYEFMTSSNKGPICIYIQKIDNEFKVVFMCVVYDLNL